MSEKRYFCESLPYEGKKQTATAAKGQTMTSPDFATSEHNSALREKFQGNGWTLTCSAASKNELSAILGDKVSAAIDDPKTSQPPDFPLPEYKSDWADIVFERSMGWKSDDGFAPLWLTKATEGAECALFQLPAPDHRWVVKFDGRILEPFDYRKAGWKELHEIMVHGFLLDRSDLLFGQSQKREDGPMLSTLADLGRETGDLLRSAELIRTVNNPEYAGANQKTEEIYCSVSGTKLQGLDTQSAKGKAGQDRWRSCAEDFNKHVRDRLERVFNAIRLQHRLAATVIKEALRLRDGQWSFSDSAHWMTSLGQIPYDARMVLNGKNWEIDIPNSSATLIAPDSAGMRAIARILMCNNIACPCALIVDGQLLSEFLGRPRHHKYFEAIYRRPRVECSDPSLGEVERSICAAMRLKPEWCYVADHIISEKSELHTVCQLPVGKVTLTRADALEGVRDLIKKQRARLFFCSEPSQHFKRILADIEAGIQFARKQEKLLEQVQPKSEEYRGKIQKAVYRTETDLEQKGDWTTRYDLLVDHFSQHIRCGIVCQYTGPYRWKIEGLAETPDALDLAGDHMQFKRSKLAKLKRRAKARIQAMRSLKGLGASAG
jgi:hypothetical protein